MRSLDIAGTGMQAQQTNVEVISNNIANMTTTGFKRRRAEFQDLIYQNLRRVGSNSSDNGTVVPSGAQVGLGVKTAAIYRIGEQGNLQQTSNSLDLAIRGNGHFQVTLPSGEAAYTRDGTFSLSPEGQIVTADGYPVVPGITIPTNARDVTINATGEVQVKIDGTTAPQTVGTMQLATFPNDAGLDAQGDNLLIASAASGARRHRRARQPRLRQRHAGLRGDQQRQRGDRDHQPHHRPARLRDEQPRHHRVRPDAIHPDQPAVMVMKKSDDLLPLPPGEGRGEGALRAHAG